MMVKASPASTFIMIESQLVLEFLEITLDTPPDLGQPDQLLEFDILGNGGKPIASRFLFAGRPFDQEPFRLSSTARVAISSTDPHCRELRPHHPPCPFPPAHRLPCLAR